MYPDSHLFCELIDPLAPTRRTRHPDSAVLATFHTRLTFTEALKISPGARKCYSAGPYRDIQSP